MSFSKTNPKSILSTNYGHLYTDYGHSWLKVCCFFGFWEKPLVFGKFKKHLWFFCFFCNSHGFGQFLYYELLWQPHTDMVNSTPSIMATIYKKCKRVCQHLFQQLGGIQIRHWEHLLFFMSRPACGCFILLPLFPSLPSGRDVKT